MRIESLPFTPVSLPQARKLSQQPTAPVLTSGVDTVHFAGRAKKPETYQMYINGQYTAGTSGETFDVVNPANQKVIAKVPVASPQDVDTAVKAAKAAQVTWSATAPDKRAEVLRNIAKEIRNNLDELAKLETLNNGKPIEESKADINDSARHFEVFADQLLEQKPKVVSVPEPGAKCAIEKVPYGVAGQIIPWNYPLMMAAWKLAPALAAGCTSVIKPAEQTPLTLLKAAELFKKAGLPDGAVNIVPGFGKTGNAIVTHPDVDVLSFTGSSEVGRKIAQTAAANPKGPRPVTLELGGKSANIVFKDAVDIDEAVDGALLGVMINQGEVCSAGSRILVEEPIYDAFVKKMAEKAKNITLGEGNQPGVKMGPMVSEKQTQRVMDYIEIGKQEGAQVLVGGKRAKGKGLKKGNFIQPTIFVNVKPDSRLAQEEIFGPVAVVIPFKNEEEAVKLANGTPFGLAAAIWTGDDARGKRVAGQMKAGVVWTNTTQPAHAEIPWGGIGMSGNGRHDQIEDYQWTRTIYEGPKGNFFGKGYYNPPPPPATEAKPPQ